MLRDTSAELLNFPRSQPKLWGLVMQNGVQPETKLDSLITLFRLEATPHSARWEQLLTDLIEYLISLK